MILRRTKHQLTNARRLRREMTVAETILWRCLRDRGIGEKFRRQVPIGRYIADFVCVSAKIVIELDGPGHDDPVQHAHDIKRDAWLQSRGWTVLRFPNELVMSDSPVMYGKIAEALATVRVG